MAPKRKAWVVAVEMGYGHMRAARPLGEIAEGGKIIAADDYEGIPPRDRRLWVNSRKFYHFISRLSDRGFWGRSIFNIFDSFQKIEEAGKRKTEATFQLKQGYALIRSGWGRDLIGKLNGKPIPLIATFFTIGQMAEVWGYEGPIYILATDSDISRAWAPLLPAKSRVNYLVPTETVRKHLQDYGVSSERIHLTGFPLPAELVRSAKKNLERRLKKFETKKNIVVTFAIGGAGAQANLGVEIVKSLTPLIREKKIVLYVILGTHGNLVPKFREEPGLCVFSCRTKDEYFNFFNKILAETDVLWTKPSELSFYAGLGLPIIIAPPLGAQEKKNREWLLKLGAGIDQGSPTEASRWLPELLETGKLRRAAEAGFEKIERNGAENVAKIIFKKHKS